jgi:hypothetical protein
MTRSSSIKKQKSAKKHSKLSTMRSKLTLKHHVSTLVRKLNIEEEYAPETERIVDEQPLDRAQPDNIEEIYPPMVNFMFLFSKFFDTKLITFSLLMSLSA